MTQEYYSKFRNSQNNYLTQKLFYERIVDGDYSRVLYTLKDRDFRGYPSFKRLYLECGDPTEYTFADTYLDGWDHWKLLSGTKWFQKYFKGWREELRVRKEASYTRQLEEIVATGGKDRSSAIKTLLERVKKPVEGPSRGRPVHPYREEAKTSVRLSQAQQTLSDLRRLGLD